MNPYADEYNYALFNIENDVQDKNSLAWKKLCEYIDLLIDSGKDEFSPFEYLGKDLYAEIHTLPASIAKLKKVKKIWLYGSKLKRIPPEIGEMESLEYFDPYTSYQLHWFPYEITECKNLKDSRVSTRALYGNYSYRRPFPDLSLNPVRYDSESLKCSVCKKTIDYEETNQLWISLGVGSDVLPLLVNVCSKSCEEQLPIPKEDYVAYPHKGGSDLEQPLDEDERFEIEWAKEELEKETSNKENGDVQNSDGLKQDIDSSPLIKLVRKIWEK